MQGSPQLCIRVVHIPTPQALLTTKIVQMFILENAMSEMKEIEIVKLHCTDCIDSKANF